MKEEIIIAGFGGQGVLSMAKILAYSGLMEGREVTWIDVYKRQIFRRIRLSTFGSSLLCLCPHSYIIPHGSLCKIGRK